MNPSSRILLLGTLLAACRNGGSPPQPDPLGATAAGTSGATPGAGAAVVRSLTPLGCDLSAAPVAGPDGKRRLALIVGVGEYQSDRIADLKGPPQDVEAMASLLTDPRTGYGFPKENVCVLRDGEATVAGVQRAFEQALIARAQPGDVAVFYYSGHGTQVPDRSQDEPDEKDEAFLLHDSWNGGAGVLRDDDMNALLARLHAVTDHIVVLLDACTSGGLTRDTGAVVRQVIASDQPVEAPEAPGGEGAFLTSSSLPGLVVLSAARDGSLALEPPEGGLGYFTAALVGVLGQATGPLTWAQVGRQLPRQIEQLTDRQQFPLAQGALDREVFGGGRQSRALAWDVVRAGDTLALEGVALPGWGVGAELRIYPGGAPSAELADPGRAHATVRLTQYDGVHAEARPLGPPARPIAAGDLAVLASPAPGSYRLAVAFEPGVPASTRDAVQRALTGDAEAQGMLELRERAPFTLGRSASGALRLRGPEGVTRNVFTQDNAALPAQVRRTLLQHARQQALLAARGAGAGLLQDDRTLEVRVVQSGDQACARPGWVEACPGEEQQLPLCSRWRVEVRNTHGSETLRVGGAILSSDGAILAMPRDGRALELPARSAWVPLDPAQTFSAIPPFGAVEDIVVFGTLRDTNLNWSLLEAEDPTRPGGKDVGGAIEAQLARLMTGGAKAVAEVKTAVNPWTVSHLPIRVVANVVPRKDTATCPQAASREYTIPNFDLNPYLPADPSTALYKVLQQAELLTHRRETDGVPYRQHDWSKGSDDANLAYGIDCSRAIWFAFTRAGLPYTSRSWHQGFVSTAEMFDESRGSCNSALTPDSTLMKQNFESCLGQPFQLGDVLVWQGRRPTSGECIGHTVMVIDPQDFIGWGSHGWDGSKSEEGVKLNDTGVEYQKILAKTWAKWDRTQYELKACWRHKQFIAEASRASAAEELYMDGFSCEQECSQ